MVTEPTIEMDSPTATIDEIVEAARLAPSTQNTQPWRFRVGPGRVDVFAEEARRLPVADDDGREMLLSVGCAIETLAIAAERLGQTAEVTLFPRPGREDLIATVRIRRRMPGDAVRDPALGETLPRRQTNREAYTGGAIPEEVLARLRAGVVEDGVGVFVTNDPATLEGVTTIVADADRAQNADPAFRKERAQWIGTGALGTPRVLRALARLALPHVDLGEPIAERNARRMRSAGAIAVVVSLTDDRRSRVLSGQVLLRLWLLANHLGLAVQPMSGPLEVPRMRRRLGRAIGAGHACPQHLFRLGYALRTEQAAPRLDLLSVIAF